MKYNTLTKFLMYSFWGMTCMPRYVDDPPPAPPALPEDFDVNSLSGDAWQGIIQGNETYKDNAVALNTKNPLDAIDQLINAQNLIGKDRLPSPQEDWGDDDWSKHYASLGRPEEAGAYKLENPPEIEGFELSDEFMTATNEKLFAAGLNQKQYEATMGAFFDWLGGSTTNAAEAATAQRTQSEEALKAKYGDEYEGKVASANTLVAEFGSAELSTYLEESGIGNDPRLVEFMVNLAEKFSDDESFGQSLNQNLSPPNAAIKKIAELKADDTFQQKLFNEAHPGHRNAVEEWQSLHKKAYPGTVEK